MNRQNKTNCAQASGKAERVVPLPFGKTIENQS